MIVRTIVILMTGTDEPVVRHKLNTGDATRFAHTLLGESVAQRGTNNTATQYQWY